MSYAKLFELIEKESPYGPDVTCLTDVAKAEGFGAAFNSANPSTKKADELDDKENRGSVWIHMDGEFHRCPKAMIVPVTFMRGGEEIEANIIIGYTGPGV